eukprot:TRINITY_DN586_c0_g1_i1.p1 TRINITY_DN586_c0_g1~~TRINITY_DN586_c0_g1_i1.p1  ORF type:complete len:790 (+),score=56.99 TRINITY_DN586_c0_g1_i1:18-2387(+)
MEDALRDAFAATATDCVSTGTVQNYVGYLSYWLQWTYTHRRERITPAWIERIEAWKDADEAQPEASGAAGSSSSSAHAAAAAAVARGTKRRRRPGAQLHDEIRKHLKKRDAWTDADYPICQRHTLEDYTLYLPTLRKSRHADEPVEWSTINAVTSAFSWYMGRHEMSSPPRWTEALRRYKRGMKRAAAQVLQHGGAKRARKSGGENPEPAADGDDEGGGDAMAAAAGPAAAVPVAIPVAADKATGKDPLKYLLYKRIQEDIFSDDTSDVIFARAFLSLNWNLLARPTNIECLRAQHLEWKEDALGIRFIVSKRDQEGEHADEIRHVYANPVTVKVCPILALAMYLFTIGVVPRNTDDALFPGADQYQRYDKALSRILERDGIKQHLLENGMTGRTLGAYSARKGALSYATGGTTAAPSMTAVCIRACWSVGQVKDRYLKLEESMDQYVGRLVVGLPADDPSFAMLPPHFDDPDVVRDTLREVFPDCTHAFRQTLEMCAASVLWHADLLRRDAPNHRIHKCMLLRPEVEAKLRPHVICHIGTRFDRFRATGIPPNVTVLLRIRDVLEGVGGIIPAMQRIARESQESMQKFLEERAIGLGTVTKHGLEEALQPVMQRLQALQDGFGRGPEVAEPSGNGGEPAAEDDQEQERWRWPHYTWGGRIRACPEGFRIPAGSLKEVFGEWMLGDAQRRWRPLRAFKLIDVGEKGSAKRTRLNELRQLMTIAEAGLTAAGFTITSSHTPEEVSAMWSHVVQHNIIQLQSETEQHRQRRLSQLSWLTLRRDIARLRAHH